MTRELVKRGLPSPKDQQETLEEMCERIDLETDELRKQVIRECTTWLAMHHADFKPGFLAGEMARDLLPTNLEP